MNIFRRFNSTPTSLISALALIVALSLVVAVAACSSEDEATATPAATQAPAATEAPEPDIEPLKIVATTNIIADWARNVGGDRVEVTSLLPVGGDPHSYQPGARDVAMIADADLILTNGLFLEGAWLEELIQNASPDPSKIIALGDVIDAIEFAETGAHHDHDMDDDHDDHEDEHGHDDEHEELVGRLLISDGQVPAVSVLDLVDEHLDEVSLQVAAPAATLYSSPTGRFVYALARGPEEGDDRVHIFDGGVYLEEHGDHFDLVTDPVSALTVGTTDQRPIHFSNHAGFTAIFHDGSGRIALFEEHDLSEELNDYEPVWLDAGLQHGAGVALGEGYVVVTTNNPDYPSVAGTSSLPLGAEVWTVGGDVVYNESSRACPGLHGEAANAHGVAFGCVGGVLFIEGHDGEYEYEFIENPPGMLEGARIGSVYGHHDVEHFFGSASYRQDGVRLNGGLWMIDAEGGQMSLVLPPTAEKQVRSAAFDGHGEELFVLTYDGLLNVIHPDSGDIEETYELVEAFDGDTSPSFIVVGEMLYLSDRVGGRIIEFSLAEGEIEREWAISGEPRGLAYVGLGLGEPEDEHGHDDHDDHEDEDEHDDHEDEDDHDHDEDEDMDDHSDHDHDHAHGPLDPHFWFDPNRVSNAVIDIATRFALMDPAGVDAYTANATAYVGELMELHAWTEQQVSAVPSEERILITSHDSLSYFAVVYGFEIVGTVIPSLSTDVEPSAELIAELVELIEHEGVKAVFGETTVSERIARALADETGIQFVSLYSGSLGAVGSGADTYIGMVRANVEAIVGALS